MKQIKKVVVCGPPHSGKSVFLSNLQRLLPTEHHMLIFGAPDGEWHWSNEADQDLVQQLRQKKAFTDDFADNIVNSIESADQKLVLVDTGGRRLAPNDRIFSICDAFIILSSSETEIKEWREYGESFGCICIAELDSVLKGTSELYESSDGVIRGRIAGLERGEIVKSPVLDAVANRLKQIIFANSEMSEAEMMADINGAQLVEQLGIEDCNDPYLGVRPWHIAPTLQLIEQKNNPMRIWNVRASFLACALTSALENKVELFGVSEGYITIPEVVLNKDGQGDGLLWEVTEFSEYTLVEYKKTKFFGKEMLAGVVPPTVHPNKGVVLATDGPPIWLDATIARSYAKAGVIWVGIFCPVESGRTQPGFNNRPWDEVFPSQAPIVIIYGEELGRMIPVPIEFLKWQGGGRRWQLGSGEFVIDREQSHAQSHSPVIPFLQETFSKIDSRNQEYVIEEIDMGRVIGESVCVETKPGDEVVYAQRPGRIGLTRFVKNRQPQPCPKVTVLMKREEDHYILLTAFIGNRAPAEPWDLQWANENSKPFWNSHALVWGLEKTISGTETTECPW